MTTNPTPYQVLDALSDDQLDLLLTLSADQLNEMLSTIVWARVAKRLWNNASRVDLDTV